MSVGTIKELIAKEQLNPALLSHFVDFDSGQLTLTYECEYWDYKRELPALNNSADLAELAADVLAFHNTRGGYIIFGITDDHSVLGLHGSNPKDIQSVTLNAKLKKYLGDTFRCRYAYFDLTIGGTRKCLAVIFIPPRKGDAVRFKHDAPGSKPLFRGGELFIRAGDTRKRPESNADFLFVNNPLEPEVTVGSHQLTATYPRPGFRLFVGDYVQKTGFIGDKTRLPLITRTIDQLLYDKWDVIVLRGVGGVGKTALATEITASLENDAQYHDLVGGLISLSAKSQQLTPFALSSLKPEIGTYDEFLTQLLSNTTWDGDIPQDIDKKETLAKQLIRDNKILLFIDNYETVDTPGSRISRFIRDLPSGAKTLITSKHRPISVPAVDVYLNPLDRDEGQILAIAEAQVQRLGSDVVQRWLDDILKVSECLPLAIKWIIGCSKNSAHLKELIDEYYRGKPSLDNLCEFCFTFEYTRLSDNAKKALILLPVFTRIPPTARELAVAADVDVDTITAALDELTNFSLVSREHSTARGEEVYRSLRLTAHFALQKLTDFPDLDRQARRRLKNYYGTSVPMAISAAKEMIARGATAAARQYLDEEVLDREPNNAEAYFLKGDTYERDGLETLALPEYDKALVNAEGNKHMITVASLRLAALRRKDPQISREQTIPSLERAYGYTQDNRLALELARDYQMMERPERSEHYYNQIYRNYHVEEQDMWDEAVLFLCQRIRDQKGARPALDFVRSAERVCPTSKILRSWERILIDEAGDVKWTHKPPK